jgi:tyrosyl-tRNA synthetase
LGRSIPLLKLRDFQELGHQAVFIIGDFTGVIGDTSDKDSERPLLEKKAVEKNLKTYLDQAGKIIDIKKAEIRKNSEWLGELTFGEIGLQADQFSVSEFISRENIKKRLDGGKRVSLRETLYPLMQGYDSVAVRADVEIGGTDQRFNLLSGRTLQKFYKQTPQDIITNPLIEGLDGRKMSSSWGNTVNLLDAPNDMFGKIMSLRDEFIIRYFTLLTRVSLEEIGNYEKALANGENPRDIKIKLAREITRFYHGENEADAAEKYFVSTISKKEMPDEMPETKPKNYDLLSFLLESGLFESRAEAKRTLAQKGVRINKETVTDPSLILKPGDVVQKGKLHFRKVR